MAQQDCGYKRLFAHREMVADLLTGFVREPWVAEVELDTLERVSGSYVSDDLRERKTISSGACAGGDVGFTCTCCWSFRRPWTASWRCGSWSTSGCCTRT